MKEFEIENGILKKYHEQEGKTIVEIPDSVKKIGFAAFWHPRLKEVIIPDSVTEIDYLAFHNSSNLKEVIIPDSVIKIGSLSFCECTSLRKVIISTNTTKIEHFAFSNCSSLKEITIPKSVIKIGYNIILGCENLDDIIIYSYSTLELLDDAYKKIALTSFIKNYLTKQIKYTKEDIEKFKKYIKKEKEYLLKISFKNPFVMYFLLNEIGEKFITYNEINNVINDYVEEIQPLDIKSIALLREYIKNNYDTDIDKQKKIGVI